MEILTTLNKRVSRTLTVSQIVYGVREPLIRCITKAMNGREIIYTICRDCCSEDESWDVIKILEYIYDPNHHQYPYYLNGARVYYLGREINNAAIAAFTEKDFSYIRRGTIRGYVVYCKEIYTYDWEPYAPYDLLFFNTLNDAQNWIKNKLVETYSKYSKTIPSNIDSVKVWNDCITSHYDISISIFELNKVGDGRSLIF